MSVSGVMHSRHLLAFLSEGLGSVTQRSRWHSWMSLELIRPKITLTLALLNDSNCKYNPAAPGLNTKHMNISLTPPHRTMVRYRPKGVFGKGVANSKKRQKCVKKCVRKCVRMRQNGSSSIGKRGTYKMRQKCVKIASKMRQKCAEHLWGRTPFGRYPCR